MAAPQHQQGGARNLGGGGRPVPKACLRAPPARANDPEDVRDQMPFPEYLWRAIWEHRWPVDCPGGVPADWCCPHCGVVGPLGPRPPTSSFSGDDYYPVCFWVPASFPLDRLYGRRCQVPQLPGWHDGPVNSSEVRLDWRRRTGTRDDPANPATSGAPAQTQAQRRGQSAKTIRHVQGQAHGIWHAAQAAVPGGPPPPPNMFPRGAPGGAGAPAAPLMPAQPPALAPAAGPAAPAAPAQPAAPAAPAGGAGVPAAPAKAFPCKAPPAGPAVMPQGPGKAPPPQLKAQPPQQPPQQPLQAQVQPQQQPPQGVPLTAAGAADGAGAMTADDMAHVRVMAGGGGLPGGSRARDVAEHQQARRDQAGRLPNERMDEVRAHAVAQADAGDGQPVDPDAAAQQLPSGHKWRRWGMALHAQQPRPADDGFQPLRQFIRPDGVRLVIVCGDESRETPIRFAEKGLGWEHVVDCAQLALERAAPAPYFQECLDCNGEGGYCMLHVAQHTRLREVLERVIACLGMQIRAGSEELLLGLADVTGKHIAPALARLLAEALQSREWGWEVVCHFRSTNFLSSPCTCDRDEQGALRGRGWCEQVEALLQAEAHKRALNREPPLVWTVEETARWHMEEQVRRADRAVELFIDLLRAVWGPWWM